MQRMVSPQQINKSHKPNIENMQPQRNTVEFVKKMKQRSEDNPMLCNYSDAKSILISRIDNHSTMSSRQDMDVFYMQMNQLYNENMQLKQRLEQQEQQRMQMLQQQLMQLQHQVPIVINNNIMSGKEEARIVNEQPKYQTPNNQEIKQEKNASIVSQRTTYRQNNQSPRMQQQNTSHIQYQNQGSTQASVQKSFQQQISNQLYSSPPQEQLKPQSQQSNINTTKIQSEQDNSIQQYNIPQLPIQAQNLQQNLQKFETVIHQNTSQSDKSETPIKPGVRLDFDSNPQYSLADYFKKRKQTAPPLKKEPEEVEWVVNVKQRSKEEQIKLRKEMMNYGRKQQKQEPQPIARAISPVMERLISGQKAKVEQKEMFALTKKNYEKLPEVQQKKQDEIKKAERLNFIKERQEKIKELDDKLKRKETNKK
ncbi:hypothetical protein pb186bvf_018993 [Paramecium bursaria]